MLFNFARPNDTPPQSPAERWSHDRRIIASWLQREADGHFDGAELRADGSSFIAISSPLGQLTVHDYWSFSRPDFDSRDRVGSYARILSRQVPILTLGYTRPGDSPTKAELVLFLNGEVTIAQGYTEAFGPLVKDKPVGDLVAIENTPASSSMNLINPYSDPFLVKVIAALCEQSRKPPGR